MNLIIGESPSRTRPADKRDLAFSGKTSHILWEELEKYNLSRDSFFITNIVDKLLDTKLTKIIIKSERKRLESEVFEHKPKMILTVGKLASEEILNKNIYLTREAGTPIYSDYFRAWVIPCIHPSACARNPSWLPLFKECIYIMSEVIKLLEANNSGKRNRRI